MQLHRTISTQLICIHVSAGRKGRGRELAAKAGSDTRRSQGFGLLFLFVFSALFEFSVLFTLFFYTQRKLRPIAFGTHSNALSRAVCALHCWGHAAHKDHVPSGFGAQVATLLWPLDLNPGTLCAAVQGHSWGPGPYPDPPHSARLLYHPHK